MTPPATTTPGRHRSLFGPIERCPRCGATALDTIAGGDDLSFRCVACATTWRYELGHVLLTSSSTGPVEGCTIPA